MSKRVNISEVESAGYKAMLGLEGYLQNINLTQIQKELIKIRASQINGCAYCLDMHTKAALKYGETTQRIFVLEGWRETHLFSDEEKVLLAMTEEITLISKKGLSDKTYEKAQKYFTENQIAQIIMAIVTINAWNRIAVSTHLQVPN
ncbi:MAG: carboxymuconolactone decarboxylase family protein [Chryseobacterium sp.]|nr:carboxymuconolactone decarboxylase family protein [Candidatus Chryseobacterium enterohippi]